MNRYLNSIGVTSVVTTLFFFMLTGCSSNQNSDGYDTPPQTPEEELRSTAYVGEAKCLECHGDIHESWLTTAHAQTLRDGSLEASYINDSDDSGRPDFFDVGGLELKGDDDFSKYDEDAPKLGSDQSGPYMEIGDKKYYISHTVGGFNEQWKQLYLTKIGNSHYVLPVQYNAKTKEYVNYTPEDEQFDFEDDTQEIDSKEQGWYDKENVPQEIGLSRSFERLCAGCHVTGLQIEVSDEGEWAMEYVDSGVTCEACHGPGQRHVLLPLKENIINPATMIFQGKVANDADEAIDNDLNVDGVVNEIDQLNVRNMVCLSCHSFGEGYYRYPNELDNTDFSAYPSKVDADGEPLFFIPGLNWQLYFKVIVVGDNVWSHPNTNNSLASKGFSGFIASKNHQQHQLDFGFSPHAPDTTDDYECFICHDMHSLDDDPKEHLVTTSINGIPTNEKDNNTLCLACHAGREGDFAELTADEVGVANAKDAVEAHMSRVGMAGEGVVYDPGGTGQGRCTGCHMPKTGQSAVRDENGLGDISSHTFRVIWPSKNEMDVDFEDLADDQVESDLSLLDLPNACNECHYEVEEGEMARAESGTEQVLAWAKSGHGNEDSEAWSQRDWDGAAEYKECQRCHTATGAKNYLAAPTTYDPDDNTFDLLPGENQVLYCSTCHSNNPNENDGLNVIPNDADILAPYSTPNVVAYPDAKKSNMCLVCHIGIESGAVIKEADASNKAFENKDFIHAHYLPAGGLVYKKIGYEFENQDYANPSHYKHHEIDDTDDGMGPCIGCHMSSPGADDHSFLAVEKENETVVGIESEKCLDCHAGTESEFVAFLNFQKNGLNALLDVLLEELESTGFIYSPKWPYFFRSTDNSFDNRIINWEPDEEDEGNGQNNMGAAFNYILISQEPGAYVHNSRYAKRLVFDAIDWLDHNDLTGTIDFANYPDAAEYLQNDGDTSNDGAVVRP